MKWTVIVLVMSLGLAGSTQAQAPDRIGEEFQVNSYTTSRQVYPAVAVEPRGDFVVVWMSDGSYGTDTSGYSIQAQRYGANGAAAGGEFQVNAYTTNFQGTPAVAVDPEGDFVVVWMSDGSYGTDTSSLSIQGQRYDSGGALVGGQFQVNAYTTGGQVDPAVAVDPQGDFVVVWTSPGSYGTDTSPFSIQGRLYDASGAPVGDQFQVNAYTTGSQVDAAVAVDSQGNFVVVWASYGSYDTDRSSASIQGQRYDADGAPVGGQFQVNSYTTSSQRSPSVAVEPLGDFVVVWRSNGSYGTDASEWSIQGQRYDSDGAPVGDQFQVNSYTTTSQLNPSVAVEPLGDFVVVWTSYGSYGTDTSGDSIQGQRYDSDGAPLGDQFQVNSYTSSDQRTSSVAVDADGDFVVVWDSDGSLGTDNSFRSIQGQRFSVPLFSDGFESGNTSAWSSSVP